MPNVTKRVQVGEKLARDTQFMGQDYVAAVQEDVDKRTVILKKANDLATSTGFDQRRILSAVRDVATVERALERRRWWRKSQREIDTGKKAVQEDYEVRALEHPDTIVDLLRKSDETGLRIKRLYRALRAGSAMEAGEKARIIDSGHIVAIDYGGTYIKWSVYDQQQEKFIQSGRENTPQAVGQDDKDRRAFVSSVCDVVSQAAGAAGVSVDSLAGVGMGLPAGVDSSGNIEYVPFLEVRDVNIRREVFDRLGINVTATGDANVQTLGAAKELEKEGKLDGNLMGVTVGTAVGFAVITKGERGYSLTSAPQMHFDTELQRGSHRGMSIGAYISTPDHYVGWRVAGRGVVNELAYRLEEAKGTQLLQGHTVDKLSEMASEEKDDLFQLIQAADNNGDNLCRRIMSEAKDPTMGLGLSGDRLRDHVVSKVVGTLVAVRDSQLTTVKLDGDTPQKIDDAANVGDTFAKEILEETGRVMGDAMNVTIGLSTCLPQINPKKIVFFGGIPKSSTWFNTMEETIRNGRDFDGEMMTRGQETNFLGAVTLVQLDLKHKVGSLVKPE